MKASDVILTYSVSFCWHFEDPIYVLHLNVTEILFKTQPVGGVDYGLLLWNRKQVVFINIYNHLGIGYEVVLIKLFYKYIFFHKPNWPKLSYGHFLGTFSWTFLIRWNIDLESRGLFILCKNLNEGKDVRTCTPLNAFCFMYQCSPSFDLLANLGCFQMLGCSLAVILQVADFLGSFLTSFEKVLPLSEFTVSRNDFTSRGECFGLHLLLFIFRMSRLWKCHFWG